MTSKSPKATVPSKRQPMLPIPKPSEIEPASIAGLYADEASIISKMLASLCLVPGTFSDGDVKRKMLVPFAEVRLGGLKLAAMSEQTEGEDFDPPTLFLATLPMENFAYVLLDLTSDLKNMCAEVAALARGDLAVDPVRMAHVRYFVSHLERQARICRIRLDQAYGEPSPNEG